MPYVLSNLAKGEFLSRELIRDEGPKNRRYKYHVVESKLKEWGEDQIASYYSLMNSYTKFKGERGVEERIKEDRNFLDLMEKIKKINIDCYKQLGGAYLDVILDNSKFNET